MHPLRRQGWEHHFTETTGSEIGVASPQRKGRGAVLGRTEGAAAYHLSSLSCLLAFPSQLQVHMVLQLCPVLGDHKYSAYVGTVLGQRFLLPAENTKPQRQVPKPTCLLPPGGGLGVGVDSISRH